jgi:NAD(P)-dependent dehydrogenase (short-subunit alcohol dehydrogenase family)
VVVHGRELIDGALELSVVGSFSRIGYEVRRRLYEWRDAPPGVLAGRTVLITGPTSGLGRAASELLAGLGARLLLVGRDAAKLDRVREGLGDPPRGGPHRAVVADMSTLASVAAAVDAIRASEPRLDVVIDNAGAIHPHRRETADGLEATFATMVVGPFALVSGLLPLLRAGRRPRVIAVTSGGMYAQPLDLDDLQSSTGTFNGTRAYARAKRAQVALMREWARRLGVPERDGIAYNAMHPGWAATPGLEEALPTFARVMGPLLRTADQGIDTLVWLAAGEEGGGVSGRLYLDRRPRPFDRSPTTRLSSSDRERLWDAVVELARVDDPLHEMSGRPDGG